MKINSRHFPVHRWLWNRLVLGDDDLLGLGFVRGAQARSFSCYCVEAINTFPLMFRFTRMHSGRPRKVGVRCGVRCEPRGFNSLPRSLLRMEPMGRD
jgi:hypothetical protein